MKFKSLSRVFSISFPTPVYRSTNREKFEEKEWRELRRYVNFLKNYWSDYGLEDASEIKVGDSSAELKGFFGKYRFEGGRIHEWKLEKLSKEELRSLFKKIRGLAPLLGERMGAISGFVDLAYDGIRLDLSYSDLLNQITLSLMSGNPPARLITNEYVSPETQGQIDISKTIKKRFQGENLCVSKKTNSTIETLPILLLLKFHRRILSGGLDGSSGLNRLMEEIKAKCENSKCDFSLTRKIEENESYHSHIINHPFYGKFLKLAEKMDFKEPEVLEKTRKEAFTSPHFRDLILLWEAYLEERVPKPRLEQTYLAGYSLKPINKLYELWVLAKLKDTLKEVLGVSEENVSPIGLTEKGKAKIKIGQIKLFYNKAPSKEYKKIKILQKNGRVDRHIPVGLPDFTIAVPSRKLVPLIIDAKYKPCENLSNDDIRQMFKYMIGHEWNNSGEKAKALLTYVDKTSEKEKEWKISERSSPNAEVWALKLRPSKKEKETVGGDRLQTFCEDVLKNKCPEVLSE